MNSDQALQELLAGNQRYVAGQLAHPHQTVERRDEVTQGQHPFACVVTCSDSRVPPELIFDQGLGDLFVVRVAGNIVDDVVLGSIEYAGERLGTPLVMVLGHSQCGAVTAAVKGGVAPGHIGRLTEALRPAVERAKSRGGDLVDNAIRVNVELIVGAVRTSWPILAEMIQAGKLKVVGGYYDLRSGLVSVIA